MVVITSELKLDAISLNDAATLRTLMQRIYPPPYNHLWEDDGTWYVEATFDKAVIKKELADPNSAYYFVKYVDETIGILRHIHDLAIPDFPHLKATKLHRIYLDPSLHGKGIGAVLMDWVKTQAIEQGSQLLWLEAMDTQHQALRFYKHLGYTISSDFRLPFKLMHKHLRGMHRMYKML